MTKKCSKCKSEFDCRMDDIKKCHCSTVKLDAKTLKLLNEKYENCLCEKCLKEFETKTV
ncbi:cysteine-rich CWC family protein [Crocinitomix sp.]|nr:cysteine-rich CWC family protein [Crocinitomix sp.]